MDDTNKTSNRTISSGVVGQRVSVRLQNASSMGNSNSNRLDASSAAVDSAVVAASGNRPMYQGSSSISHIAHYPSSSSLSSPSFKEISETQFVDANETVSAVTSSSTTNARAKNKHRRGSSQSLTSSIAKNPEAIERIPSASSMSSKSPKTTSSFLNHGRKSRSYSSMIDANEEEEALSDDNDSSQGSDRDILMNKHPWTVEEDEILLEKQGKYGNRWKNISMHLQNRSQEQIKARFKSILRASRREWTTKEDDLLQQLVHDTDSDWVLISSHFPKRTKNSIKKRHQFLLKNKDKSPSPPIHGAPNQVFYYRRYPHKSKKQDNDMQLNNPSSLSLNSNQPAASPLKSKQDSSISQYPAGYMAHSSNLPPSLGDVVYATSSTNHFPIQGNFAKPMNQTQQIWQQSPHAQMMSSYASVPRSLDPSYTPINPNLSSSSSSLDNPYQQQLFDSGFGYDTITASSASASNSQPTALASASSMSLRHGSISSSSMMTSTGTSTIDKEYDFSSMTPPVSRQDHQQSISQLHHQQRIFIGHQQQLQQQQQQQQQQQTPRQQGDSTLWNILFDDTGFDLDEKELKKLMDDNPS